MEKFRIKQFFPRPGFPLAITHERSQCPLSIHQHEFGELVIIVGGSGVHVTRRNDYQVNTGDVFFIPAGQAHGYRDTRNLELFNVLMVPNEMPPQAFPIQQLPGYHALFHLEPRFRRRHQFESHLRLAPDGLEEALVVVRNLQREIDEAVSGFELMATGLLLQLVAALSRQFARVRTPARAELLKMDQAIGVLVKGNSMSRPRVADLAKKSGMSMSTFQRAFRRATETSPARYALQHRLRQAAAALRQPESSVTEAAFAAGFSDSNYFSRLFRRHYGTSPRAWRKKNLPA